MTPAPEVTRAQIKAPATTRNSGQGKEPQQKPLKPGHRLLYTMRALHDKEEIKMLTIEKIREAIENKPTRSAWSHGVKSYAVELLDGLAENIQGGYIDPEDLESPALLKKAMLNGAADWSQYSAGGCSLIYDGDIAERLCTPSELKRKRGGDLQPNSRESWLDVQARALSQAARWIINAARA